MIRLTHVITGLGLGGAELMLCRLLAGLDKSAFAPRVISLKGDGPVGEKIRALGVPTQFLNLHGAIPNPLAFARLRSWLRGPGPHVVQTWMYHADLLGGLAAKSLGLPVVWGVRQSDLSPRFNKRTTLAIAKLCAKLSSRVPAKIVCNSQAALLSHAAYGYAREKMTVIPNAFDTDTFRPDPAAYADVRRELRLPAETLLAGLFGRFDPVKGHHDFFRAAAQVARKTPTAFFLLAGPGVDADNPSLKEWIRENGLEDRCLLLGPRADMPRLMAALDVYVLASLGESLPNVVGEAMSCAVPCVITAVGDAPELLADAGKVVPPADPSALAQAVVDILSSPQNERRALGERARRHIEGTYGISAIASRFGSLYRSVAERGAVVRGEAC